MKIIIKPNIDVAGRLRELLSSGELLLIMAWRDILVRYKQAFLGLGWSLLRPLLTTGVFVVVFGKVAKLPSEGLPYSMLVLAALIPWMFFSHTLTIGASALIDNAQMLRRTYVPRLVMPTASVVIHLTDTILALIVFIGLSIFWNVSMDLKVLLLPFLIIHTFLLTMGTVYFISILAVRWRDVIYLLPFLVQIGLFVSPIGYSTKLIPDNLKYYFYLNPMVGLVEAFRWSLLAGRTEVHWDAYLISLGLSIVIFIGGLLFFIYREPRTADLL